MCSGFETPGAFPLTTAAGQVCSRCTWLLADVSGRSRQRWGARENRPRGARSVSRRPVPPPGELRARRGTGVLGQRCAGAVKSPTGPGLRPCCSCPAVGWPPGTAAGAGPSAGPCTPVGDRDGTPASAWPGAGCCGRLRSEPADGSSLSPNASQINKLVNYKSLK